MTGLDKITEKIRSESEQHCAETIAHAEKTAAEIAQKAAAKIEAERESAETKSDEAAKAVVYRALASVEQQKKQTQLKAKISAINAAIDEAKDAFEKMPADKYFEALLALFKANAQPGSGVMKLSAKDLARLPEGFAARLDGVTISKAAANITSGFVLVYGDIEVNCTVDALVAEKRDELMEAVNSIVFETQRD